MDFARFRFELLQFQADLALKHACDRLDFLALSAVGSTPTTRVIERKNILTTVTAIETKDDTGGGSFLALGATWVRDSQGDTIRPGAFRESIRKNNGVVPLLFNHNRDIILGVASELQEQAQGLSFVGKLARTQAAREVRELLRMGALTGFSIGFSVDPGGEERDKKGGRLLTSISLHELSATPFPAQDGARLRSVS